MADQTALKQAFADYARTISRRYAIGEVLYRLTDQVVSVLEVDGAGVCIGDRSGRLVFVTATDGAVARVEHAQVDKGEGPCHDAHRSGDLVTVSDLTVEDRWPTYTRVAVAAGMRAVAGIPMTVDDERIGALNLYATQPREWPADDIADAQLLADMATGYVINARTLSASERLAAQLQHALDSRVVIEQAKGVVAASCEVDPAAAFRLLRDHARRHNANLHDIAAAVVERTLDL